jgi:hypothetical protein
VVVDGCVVMSDADGKPIDSAKHHLGPGQDARLLASRLVRARRRSSAAVRGFNDKIDPLPDEIKDRGQVRAMWQWARDLDRDNLLWCEFCRPIEVEAGSKEDLAIQLTEGWILGCSPTLTNQ